MIVVTGAAGLVGNVLVRELLAQGTGDLRALVRPGGSRAGLAGLEVPVIAADLGDRDALGRAFRGADIVFHAAGVVSIARGGLRRLRQTNVEGTRTVIAACRDAGVGRLVYTSSVHAFVEPPSGTALTEGAPIDPSRSRGAYDKTKAEATLLVLEACRQGLDAVIGFPSGIIGPYDFRPSHTGELILACARGRLRAYVDGAYNFVDVRDVARGLIAAAERGRRGEGYLLCGHEITVAGLIDTIAAVTSVPAPRLKVPLGFARAVSSLMPAYYWVTRERPLFTSYSLDVVSSNYLMSHEKATRELGFSPRPFRETIEDAVRWFRGQGRL
jgi:dihydroflavonol-4-reductase